MVGMFLRRGVLHTPLYHTQRKRTIIWGFMVYAIIPCGMCVGRMQYAPTRVHKNAPRFSVPSKVEVQNAPRFGVPSKVEVQNVPRFGVPSKVEV